MLKSKVENNEENVSTITTKLSDIESKITLSSENIDKIKKDITDKETLLNNKISTTNSSLSSLSDKVNTNQKNLSSKADKIDLDKKANKEHTHTISDITNLETTLSNKANKTDVITKTDLNSKADKIDLDKKANKTHKHTISDITNLETTLSNKANKSDVITKNDLNSKADKIDLDKKANLSHTHKISDITNLQTTLDEKANKTDIVSKAELDKKANKSEVVSKYDLDKKADKEHTHSISDITNLQSNINSINANTESISKLTNELDNKINKYELVTEIDKVNEKYSDLNIKIDNFKRTLLWDYNYSKAKFSVGLFSFNYDSYIELESKYKGIVFTVTSYDTDISLKLNKESNISSYEYLLLYIDSKGKYKVVQDIIQVENKTLYRGLVKEIMDSTSPYRFYVGKIEQLTRTN